LSKGVGEEEVRVSLNGVNRAVVEDLIRSISGQRKISESANKREGSGWVSASRFNAHWPDNCGDKVALRDGSEFLGLPGRHSDTRLAERERKDKLRKCPNLKCV
jgi:hypothetical protein